MRCFSFTEGNLLMTRETVLIDTPASLATSLMEMGLLEGLVFVRMIYDKYKLLD